MIRRLVLACALLPAAAFAQLQVFQYDGTTERPISGSFDLGSTAAGDTQQARFRVRNLGAAPVNITTVSLSGTGFKLTPPPLPFIAAALGANALDLRVSFSPPAIGSYSATLLINTTTTVLRATGVASALLAFGGSPLASGGTADFGKTETGTTVTQSFTLNNPNSTKVTVNSVAVSGAAFQGPNGISMPLNLDAGASATFQVVFEPQTAQVVQGALQVDGRSFVLTGQGLNPPLPKASITLDSQVGLSAKQMHVAIALASTSKVAGSGTLTMEFHPNGGLPDDPAIQFLSGARRNATVTIDAGASAAKIGGQASFAFQTGTTAGTIVFTLTMPNSSDQFMLPIVPATVNADTATGTRRVNDLDVNISGFDNTHSLSKLLFTFYDQTGRMMQPGVISYDATQAFQTYFTSAQAAGGTFLMRATFNVSGDATQIGSVDVQIANSAGIVNTQRITF